MLARGVVSVENCVILYGSWTPRFRQDASLLPPEAPSSASNSAMLAGQHIVVLQAKLKRLQRHPVIVCEVFGADAEKVGACRDAANLVQKCAAWLYAKRDEAEILLHFVNVRNFAHLRWANG